MLVAVSGALSGIFVVIARGRARQLDVRSAP
jgi:hypothetical protein